MSRTIALPLALTFLFALSAPPPALAQMPVPEARVDSVFADVDWPTKPGCAVSVMRDGALVYEQGYGRANLEYGIPITPRSVFHVASVSKHFTAMAVELLVNEGKVSWDDDIRRWVPEVPDFGTPITLRHLVHHVSGIRDQWNLLGMAGWRWESDVVTQKDVLDITSRQTALNFRPGERYLYSNTGFTLLAVVVERVTGMTLRAFAQERIFAPLGMNDTHFHDDHEMIVPGRAWAYAPDPNGLYGLKGSIPDFDVVGATSLFTTVHDLAAWDRNFINARVGGREALTRMQERFVLNSGDTIPYAHGLIHGTYRGLRTLGHGGSDAGYRSQFVRFPDQGLSVAVLCNFPTSDPGTRANRVAEAYLDGQMQPRPARPGAGATVPVPRPQLAALGGWYRGELPYQATRIRLDGDTLRLGVSGGPALRPLGEARFEVVGPGTVITLRPGTGGAPATMEGALGRAVRHDPWEPSEADLAAIAGTYASKELGTEYRLVVEGGKLVAKHRKLDDAPLTPALRDSFLLAGALAALTRDGSGRVTGFTLSDGRVWNVRFEREGS
jgi:CubicO group peptidase (beta-lactamase class C family)